MDSLREECDLYKSDQFAFIHISKFLGKHPLSIDSIPLSVWQYFPLEITTVKGISLFYNILQHKLFFTKPPPLL